MLNVFFGRADFSHLQGSESRWLNISQYMGASSHLLSSRYTWICGIPLFSGCSTKKKRYTFHGAVVAGCHCWVRLGSHHIRMSFYCPDICFAYILRLDILLDIRFYRNQRAKSVLASQLNAWRYPLFCCSLMGKADLFLKHRKQHESCTFQKLHLKG